MKFVAAHVDVSAPGMSQPREVAFLLHGILGSGANLRTFARHLVRAHPDWLVVLVDLRNHGASKGAPGPHTVEACADDLCHLARDTGRSPSLVIGHSFGGKVALQYARSYGDGLREVWFLDSPPGPGTATDRGEVGRLLQLLRQVPMPIDSRAALVERLLGHGVSPRVAQWMTTNLVLDGRSYRWRFDLAGVQQMIADYLKADLWPFLHEAPAQLRIEGVRGDRSDRWTPEDLSRFDTLPSNVSLRTLQDAGHWLHVDNPSGLRAMIGEAMARVGGTHAPR